MNPDGAILFPPALTIKLDDILTAKGSDIPSLLAAALMGSKNGEMEPVVTYANEYELLRHVWNMVEDAIRCLGLDAHVAVHAEIEIYTLYPDLVLILQYDGRTFFVVQVLAPSCSDHDDNDPVFQSKTLAAQMYSFLRGMQQHGNTRPMGAITTFEKLVLVTLDDYGEEKDHQDILSQAKANLSTGIVPNRDNDVGPQAATSNPNDLQKKITDTVLKYRDFSTGSDDDLVVEETNLPPLVYFSEIYKEKHVFPALLQGLEIAYLQFKKDEILPTLPMTRHGDDLARRLLFRVSQKGYKWVISPQKYRCPGKPKKQNLCDFKADANHLPDKKSDYFYLLAKGAKEMNGVVHIACNRLAHLCCIKIYHMKKSFSCTNEEREVDDDVQFATSWEAAREEEKYWNLLYPSKGAWKQQLGARPCLIFPHGIPASNAQERANLLPAIEKELTRFAKEHQLAYDEYELSWKLVLVDSNQQVFLSNLGSLEKFGGRQVKDAKVASVVEMQMKVLKDKMEKGY